MKYIVLLIESFLYFLNIEMIITKIIGYRKKNCVYLFFVFLLYIFLAIFAVFLKNIFIYVFMTAQIIQVLLIRLINKKSKLVVISGIYLFIYGITLVAGAFFEGVFSLSPIQSFVVELILYTIVFLASIICCHQRNIKNKIIYILGILPRKVKVVLLAYLLVNTVFLAAILSYIPSIEIIFWSVILRSFVAFIAIFVFILAPIIIIIAVSNSYLKSQNERFQKDIEAQAKHYSDLAKANYELRRFKHDFGNMKIGLSQSLKEGDCAGALDMLNSAAIDMQRSSEEIVGFDTGNGIVDAILADKQSRAKINNTKIVFSGSVPPNSIAPTDLCIIFGNTLDNAIEACEKISGDTEKIVFVTCKCSSGFVLIDITNPVAENVSIHGTNVETSKIDKASHGYGLYSLNKTVKKLDGEVKLFCENKIFKVEIDFFIEQNIIYA